MSSHYPRVRVRSQNGYLVLREGLSACFYMRQSHKAVAHAVMRSLEAFRSATGPSSLGLYADEEGEWHSLEGAGWKRIQHELLNEEWALIRLLDGAEGEERYRFEYHGKDSSSPSMNEPGAVCAVGFWLPSEFLEEHGPRRVRELALELAAPLPFCYGHVGLSFNGITDLVGMDRELGKWRFRYPGIDLVDLSGMSWKLGTRVRGPSWLTFLGQPVLGELGGAESLRARLQTPGTTVQELEGDRAVITLGEWPEAGDIEQGNVLPAYRELARVLEPWTYREERLRGYGFEEHRRWERRFLD